MEQLKCGMVRCIVPSHHPSFIFDQCVGIAAGTRAKEYVTNIVSFQNKAQLCRQYLATCYVATFALKDRAYHLNNPGECRSEWYSDQPDYQSGLQMP